MIERARSTDPAPGIVHSSGAVPRPGRLAYREHLVTDDPAVCDGYRFRARSLLDGLDTAVVPLPDLRASLSAARAELELA